MLFIMAFFFDQMIIYTTYAMNIEIICMFKGTRNPLQSFVKYNIAREYGKLQNGIQHDEYLSKVIIML